MKKSLCILVAFLLMVGVFSACSMKKAKDDLEETSGSERLEDVEPTSSIMITEEQKQKEMEKVVLTLYFADAQANKLVAEKRFVPKSSAKNASEMANMAINELMKGPISGHLVSPLPKGVKAPKVRLEKNTAIVDLPKEFVEKHPGGSTGETLTIYSIVNTLVSINGIDQVQFTIEGKKVEEFKGHLDISKPFKANKDIVAEEKSKESSISQDAEKKDDSIMTSEEDAAEEAMLIEWELMDQSDYQ
ncbi:MAG: GerMN domain-containing protein [Clostridiaceae bacterium]|nr:GerMN domain-containing protein [Clostridiaceae bacterium]